MGEKHEDQKVWDDKLRVYKIAQKGPSGPVMKRYSLPFHLPNGARAVSAFGNVSKSKTPMGMPFLPFDPAIFISTLPSYTYPPYHQGFNFEEYFVHWWYTLPNPTKRTLIPVSWTLFPPPINAGKKIQLYLYQLPPTIPYFVVCIGDIFIQERLPPNTQVFCVSSRGASPTCPSIIPIPLVCSPIPTHTHTLHTSKDLLCSFVGANSHPIRNLIYQTFKHDPDFSMALHPWNINVPPSKFEDFVTRTLRSKFVLCPRGQGQTSFRLYEVMQLGSVPVYVSDTHQLPWSDQLDWNEFCVIVHPHDIPNIKHILNSITPATYTSMIEKAKLLYPNYFTMDAVCTNIREIVEGRHRGRETVS